MNEEINYAEMLEIPVETVTVKRREKKKRAKEEDDLRDALVERVNGRMEENGDPMYAESTQIGREKPVKSKPNVARRLILGEFIAICALCAVIFLTNLFLPTSAINTMIGNLIGGNAEEASADRRTYSDFELTSVVGDYSDVDVAVGETGVLTVSARCSVYSPCRGTLASLYGDAETGYTAEIRHSDSFSTIMSGLDAVYFEEGETVYENVPFGFTDGNGDVRIMLYSEGSLLNCVTVNGGTPAWS